MPMEGNRLECANYRGIILLNVTYKISSNILHTRILPHVESKLGHYQAGFRRKKNQVKSGVLLRQFSGKD
jgi:hypothetical protein